MKISNDLSASLRMREACRGQRIKIQRRVTTMKIVRTQRQRLERKIV